MNVGEVLDTIEQTLLSRQLSSLERFILCQSWFGRGYSEMAPDCAYSIAHLKDIGSQLWQALSKAIGQRVTKKNLFLVLKQYLFSQTIQRGVGDRVQGSAVSAQRSTERSRRSPNGVERGEDEDCDPTALGDQERQRAVRDSDSDSEAKPCLRASAKPCLRPRGDAKGERASAKPCLPYPSGNGFELDELKSKAGLQCCLERLSLREFRKAKVVFQEVATARQNAGEICASTVFNYKSSLYRFVEWLQQQDWYEEALASCHPEITPRIYRTYLTS